MKRKIGLFLVVFLILAKVVTGVGVTGAPELSLIYGGRAAGMGTAFSGVSGDINNVMINPAGMVFLNMKVIGVTHNIMMEGINNDFVQYANPLGKYGVLGVYMGMFSYGEIEKISDRGGVLSATGETFSPYSYIVGLSYGVMVKRTLDMDISVGGSFKFSSSTFDSVNGSILSLDLSVLAKNIFKKIDIGLCFQNLGFNVDKFGTATEKLPMSVRLGISYIIPKTLLKKNKLLTSADVVYPIDESPYAAFGAEYLLDMRNVSTQNAVLQRMQIGIRVGYKTDTINSLGGISGLSAGIGIYWDKKYQLNYTLQPRGGNIEGITHSLNLVFKF